MTDTLTHRGPEGHNQVTLEATGEPTAFLGHRRLKIIDLSDAGTQPMANEDRSVLVTFNGEIYNYRELTADLDARGHGFRSKADTEVIVHGYEEFGEDVVHSLDGMFAFALWDSRERRLLLARDRAGKKPLYYHFDGERLSFASEIKALLACPWVPSEVKTEALPEYLYYGYVSAPYTMYEGILQIPPACVLTMGADGAPRVRRYWQMQIGGEQNAGLDLEQASREVRRLLGDAVRKRLVSDVPLGAFLSGGVDSSIIVGLMSAAVEEPVRTFTVGFAGEPSYDERGPARRVAGHFGTLHTEFEVSPRPVELLEKLLWHHDQPYGDSSAIPTYLVSELAKQHVTVALVGDGGDEVFGGYSRFLAARMAERMPLPAQRLCHSVSRLLPQGTGYFNLRRRLERFASAPDSTVEHRYREWVSIFGDADLSSIMNPGLRDVDARITHRRFFDLLDGDKDAPLLDRILEFNFETYLPEDLLVKVDRTSMAHALETRSPMLDTALVEYSATLPASWKVRGRTLKYLLKRSFEELLPRGVANRPKHGFGVPMDRWFRGELATVYRDAVLDEGARSEPFIDRSAAKRLLDEHLDGSRSHGHRLWTLLNLELWLRQMSAGSTAPPRTTELNVRRTS